MRLSQIIWWLYLVFILYYLLGSREESFQSNVSAFELGLYIGKQYFYHLLVIERNASFNVCILSVVSCKYVMYSYLQICVVGKQLWVMRR